LASDALYRLKALLQSSGVRVSAAAPASREPIVNVTSNNKPKFSSEGTRMKTERLVIARKRIMSVAVSAAIAATLAPLPARVAMADPIDTMVTSYQPVLSESIDANGVNGKLSN
jgi:hypothetical protein